MCSSYKGEEGSYEDKKVFTILRGPLESQTHVTNTLGQNALQKM